MSDAIAIAVDGGNSKTDLALVRADGSVLAVVRGPSSSPQRIGLEGASRCSTAFCPTRSRRPGWPPTGRWPMSPGSCSRVPICPSRSARCTRRSPSAAGRARSRSPTTPSASCAPAPTGLGRGDRVRRRGQLRRRRPGRARGSVPGAGPITGDWGGGEDVGLAGLAAAARGADGRGEPTSLERAVPGHFGLETPQALAEAVHLGRIPYARLIELAPVVLAEGESDPVGPGSSTAWPAEIVALARVALTRLELLERPVEVLLGGGLLRSGRGGLVEAVVADLARTAPLAELRPIAVAPVLGAGLLALDELGATTRRGRACASDVAAATNRRRRTADSEVLMAEIRFERATVIYPGADVPAVDDLDLGDRRRRADGAGRPVGIGQVHGAAGPRRARGGLRGHRLHRRRGRHRPGAQGSRRGDGVSELRAVPVPDRRRQHRLPAAGGEGLEGRAGAARERGRRDARARADLLERKPAQLSGGQRQRVAMGRAIVREPKACS